jgi:cobalt/nickel transport protein
MNLNSFIPQRGNDVTRFHKKLWAGLAIMAILTPLGLYLPEKLGAGGAWGEWSPEGLKKILGYIPEGLNKLADIWKAPAADYNVFGEGASFGYQVIAYIISAFVGIAVTVAAIYLITRIVRKNEK